MHVSPLCSPLPVVHVPLPVMSPMPSVWGVPRVNVSDMCCTPSAKNSFIVSLPVTG